MPCFNQIYFKIDWESKTGPESVNKNYSITFHFSGAVVVAQLVERLLPIPEVRGSNPVIDKNFIEHLLSMN